MTYFQTPNKQSPCNWGCWKIYRIYLALESDVYDNEKLMKILQKKEK